MDVNNNDKTLSILNSTKTFLIFTAGQNNENIEVKVYEENLWLTQKAMAKLYGVSIPTINEHLSNIFKTEELNENSVIRNFRITAADGKEYNTNFYNLDAIISVGYRVNSKQAVEFRKWATEVLKQFAVQGYVLDKERMKNGNFLGNDYFQKLLEEIREIRASERRFYQKITDIYATAVDYDVNNTITKDFYATVQNKLHFAITGKTAAELISTRADSNANHMGLKTWKNSPKGKILKTDVSVAKNYLDAKEIKELNRVVNMYLDYAENQAERSVAMTMQDWSSKLNSFLQFNDYELLNNLGKTSMEDAKTIAYNEYKKYQPIQDKIYKSDFDKLIFEVKEVKDDDN